MKKIIFTLILFTIGLVSNYAMADSMTEIRQERMAALIFIGFMGLSIFVYYLIWKRKHKAMMERRTMRMGQTGRSLIIESKPMAKKAA